MLESRDSPALQNAVRCAVWRLSTETVRFY